MLCNAQPVLNSRLAHLAALGLRRDRARPPHTMLWDESCLAARWGVTISEAARSKLPTRKSAVNRTREIPAGRLTCFGVFVTYQ